MLLLQPQESRSAGTEGYEGHWGSRKRVREKQRRKVPNSKLTRKRSIEGSHQDAGAPYTPTHTHTGTPQDHTPENTNEVERDIFV